MEVAAGADNIATFVEVVRQQSISAAARRLGLPKSTVSRRLQRLEQELSSQLLHRTARTIGLSTILATHRIELVVLAGYLRLVPPDVVSHFRGRILNVHPALLPKFGGPGMYGHRVHEAVIASGERLTGPTVHFVDERFDEGPVIAQMPIRVLPTDTPESLASRVLEIEHELYPRIVEAVASGSISLAADNSVVLPEGVHLNFTPAVDREDANTQITNAFFPLPF